MQTEYYGFSSCGGTYRLINLINNKKYYGSTQSFRKRQYQHQNQLEKGIHDNKHLQNAYNLYGSDSFLFEVIEPIIGEQAERLRKEQILLDINWDNCQNCYNTSKFAIRTRANIKSKTPEITKTKHIEARKGKTYEEIAGEERGQQWRKRQLDSLQTFHQSEEGRHQAAEKSAQRSGKTYEELYGTERASEVKINVGKFRDGKTNKELYGEEKAEKMKKTQAASLKQFYVDHPEAREAAKQNSLGENNPFFGKTHSEETKKFLSVIQKGVSLEEKVGKEKAKEIIDQRSIKFKKILKENPQIANKLGDSIRGKTLDEIYGPERAIEIKQKRSESRSKNYSNIRLANPDNTVIFFHIPHARKFCEEHGLVYENLSRVLSGHTKKHKGWHLVG